MLADLLSRAWHSIRLRQAAVIAGMLFMSLVVGRAPSVFWLILFGAIVGIVLLLQWPALTLLIIPVLAIYAKLELGTGSAVALNATVMAVPAAWVIWALDCLRREDWRWSTSRANRPMAVFLVSSMLSLLIGNALWDPAVPRPSNIVMVQLAQWGIFVLAAMAFWLVANMLRTERWLKALVWIFILASSVAVLVRVLPGGERRAYNMFAFTVMRAPFWAAVMAVAGGQLVFNRELKLIVRMLLAMLCALVFVHSFFQARDSSSNWVGVGAVMGVLAWLRFPRLRIPAVVLLIVLVIGGGLTERVYDFAGGAAEWEESGGSRLAVISRVIKVTMHNPITGLGPASYRAYANVEPFKYGRAYWVNPQINSHNNYVDLFAHSGIVGMAFLAWYYWEIWWEGWRLHGRYPEGFCGAVVASGLAIIASMLVLMMLADWVLPFVYNIGFPGFQASILMWLFLGAMVSVGTLEVESVA